GRRVIWQAPPNRNRSFYKELQIHLAGCEAIWQVVALPARNGLKSQGIKYTLLTTWTGGDHHVETGCFGPANPMGGGTVPRVFVLASEAFTRRGTLAPSAESLAQRGHAAPNSADQERG